ncbi:MAG: peptide chain release factor N(5)-glutamine methyltransferase [Patescibacteria group bacterium]
MTIRTSLILATQKLTAKKIPSASLDAELLLSHILQRPKIFLYAHNEYKLSQKQENDFKKSLARRLKHEPVAYITGRKEFFGLTFVVNKKVLIPRPETELLIEEAINYFECNNSSKKVLADIGTGSGCIAITLKKYLPRLEVIATEKSSGAISVARENIKKNKVKIKVIQSDLLQKIPHKKIDIITANLPYLPANRKTLKDLSYEPKMALLAGRDGLDVYEKLFKQISALKTRPQLVLCEIDPSQNLKIKKLANTLLPEYSAETKKDLAGKYRLLKLAEKK